MTEREKFEAWWASNSDDSTYTKVAVMAAWQACAEQKDTKIEFLEAIIAGDGALIAGLKSELQELKDHINKVWDDTYPNSALAETILALKNRVLNLAEDRNCWVFNARVLQNKLNSLEIK